MIRPLRDHVVIRPDPDPDVSPAGLYLPPTVKRREPRTGVVVAAGPDAHVDVGARVLYERSALEVEHNGEMLALFRVDGPGPCVFGEAA